MFHLLKIRTSIDILKNEKCKVTFGLQYIITASKRHNGRGILNAIVCLFSMQADKEIFVPGTG